MKKHQYILIAVFGLLCLILGLAWRFDSAVDIRAEFNLDMSERPRANASIHFQGRQTDQAP